MSERERDAEPESDSAPAPAPAHCDPDEETVSDAWEGVFLETSWGYGQTNVEFAQVQRVSDSGKSVLARRVPAKRVDAHRTTEQVRPQADPYGDEFWLRVRFSDRDDEPYFRGSYPFNGNMDEGTRLGSFYPVSNDPESSTTRTASGYGH